MNAKRMIMYVAVAAVAMVTEGMEHQRGSCIRMSLDMRIGCRLLLLGLFLSGISCTSKHEAHKGFPPMETLEADSVIVPPVLLGVSGLFVTNDMLVAYEHQKDTMFSFWKLPQCEYLFNAGCQGQGPNDFLMLDWSFKATKKGFKTFELDTHRVKEVEIDSAGHLNVDVVKHFNAFPFTANRFVFLADDSYCFAPLEGDNEFVLVDKNGELQSFGEYPNLLYKKEKELNFIVYNKVTAAHPSGKMFAVFYVYLKLCRIYGSDGQLLSETLLDSPPQTDYKKREVVYSYHPVVDEDYIYMLTWAGKGKNSVLEVWDWSGTPVAQYQLDKQLTNCAIASKYGKIYAVNSNHEGVIYSYKIPEIET